MNTLDALDNLPWLMLEHQVVDCLGYSVNTVDKLVDCGVLAVVQPDGCDQRRFRKVQVALLLNSGDVAEVRSRLPMGVSGPLLLSEKTVITVTGYSRNTLRKISAAGGLRTVKPAGLTNVRYLRHEILTLVVGVSK